MTRPSNWRLATVIVLGAAFLRLWHLQIYPEFFHHDHMMWGMYALHATWQTMRDFTNLWITPVLLWLFGGHAWVLRLSSALSGIAAVAATYVLGREVNERTALAAAALTATNHVFLLYSRIPFVTDPVGPILWALWMALQGWKGRGVHWSIFSGILAGTTLWSYWSSSLSVPMYLTAGGFLLLFRTRRFWRHRWHLAAWALCFVGTAPSLWQSRHVGEDYIQRTLLAMWQWDAALWWTNLRLGFGTVFLYRTHGDWGIWTGRPILLPAECACIVVSLLAWRSARSRLFVGLCWAWIGVIVFLGSCIPLHGPGEQYHILVAIPLLMILAGLGVTQLRYPALITACVCAMMWTNLATLWPAVSIPKNNSLAAAAIWMADHRDMECITFLDKNDPAISWPNGGLFGFVRDVRVVNGGSPSQCPVTLVLPGVTVPAMPDGHWLTPLPTNDGEVRIFMLGTPSPGA